MLFGSVVDQDIKTTKSVHVGVDDFLTSVFEANVTSYQVDLAAALPFNHVLGV